MFGGVFRAIAPKLTIHWLLIDHDRAACELRQGMTVDGVAREEFITHKRGALIHQGASIVSSMVGSCGACTALRGQPRR